MGKKPTQFFCDVCKADIPKSNRSAIQTIFLTEQTEGRSTKPYLYNAEIDICEKCQEHILKGNYLYGHGAQGYNTYEFRK